MLAVYKCEACSTIFVGYVEKLPKNGERMSYKDSIGQTTITSTVIDCSSDDCGITYLVITSKAEYFEIR